MRNICTIVLVIFLSFFVFNVSEVLAEKVKYVFLFLVNSGNNNSISEVNITDVNNVVEVTRHYTVPSGYYGNPSRTAIDRDGNCWVGNRATNTLVKLGNYGKGTCVDRNRNGKIDTNLDINGNGVIDSNEMIYGIDEDECVLVNAIIGENVFTEIAQFSCPGCHCSQFAIGTYNFPKPIKIQKGVRKFRIWCTESYGGENCQFKFKIDGEWISKTGSYSFGTITGKYAQSGCCSGSNFEGCGQLSYTQLTTNNDWRTDDLWASCDYCDFHMELEFNLNKDVYLEAIDYFSDDGMHIYTDAPIIRSLTDGHGVRAVCVDAQNNVYAGMFGEQKVYKLNKNGDILKVIDLSSVGCNPYGCVVDKNGLVWVSCVSQYSIVKYDPKTDSVNKYYYGKQVYGITPTADGNGVVISGFGYYTVWRIDLNGNTVWSSYAPYESRGVTVDRDDNVYLAATSGGYVCKYDKNGNMLKCVSGVCSSPTGIGLDYRDNVWVACYGDGKIVALKNDTLDIITQKVIGANHYVYSDWTGYILGEIVAPPSPHPEVEIPESLFGLLELLLSPIMILIVFSAGIGYYAESRAKSGGYIFLLIFTCMLLAFSIFTNLIPKWIIILAIVVFIGAVFLMKR